MAAELDKVVVGSSNVVNIRIGYTFFVKCINDYSNPIPWIWAREVIQNAIDAGATEIYFEVSNNTVTVRDNGHGMDGFTIETKFLTLGETQKGNTNTDGELPVGGFGKAKEIVCFTWKYWSIESRPTSRDLFYVDSNMVGIEPMKHEHTKHASVNKGTTISIDYTNNKNYDKHDWIREIKFFVKTCTTKCEIFMNAEKLQTLPSRGTKKEYDLCTMTVNKSQKEFEAGTGDFTGYDTSQGCQIFVRIGGITMFRRYMSTQIPALVTLDLKVGDVKNISLEMLNSSRESLQNKYQWKFDRIIEDILTNPRKTLYKRDDLVKIDRYAMTEAVSIKEEHETKIKAEIEEEENHIRQKEEDLRKQVCEGLIDFDTEIQVFGEIEEQKEELEEKKSQTEREVIAVARVINAMANGDKYDIEYAIKEAEKINPNVGKMLRLTLDNVYTSDMGYTFVVHKYNDKKPDIDPKCAKAQTILHAWKTVVDEMMRRADIHIKYVVGFTFDPYTEAEFVPYFMGESQVLINPTKVEQYSDPEDLGFWLFFNAAHEITHNYISNHNEDFAIKMHDLLCQMSKNSSKWRGLFRKAKQESSAKIKKQAGK
jgi:hypothetical protein